MSGGKRFRVVITVGAAILAGACSSSDVSGPGPAEPVPAFVNQTATVGTGEPKVLVRDVNGNVIRQLDGATPVCSPDATRLLYWTTSADWSRQLWVSRIDGSNARPVGVPVAGAHILDVAWSPDGARFAVAYTGTTAGVFSMRADGSGATQLYLTLAGDDPGTAVSWSPDGTELLFLLRGTNPRLRIVHIATGATRELVIDAYQARWSPDGKSIGFLEQRASTWLISVVNPDGTGRRVVKPVGSIGWPYIATNFTWTPDGRMLYSAGGGLSFLDVSNGISTPLPVAESAMQIRPHWCGTP